MKLAKEGHMKKLLLCFIAVVAAAVAVVVWVGDDNSLNELPQAQAVPDPVTCVGYPEPRVYLESQSWWAPQNGPTSHPGTGKTGHIHVETCFPAFLHLTGPSIDFDLIVRLHGMPGVLKTVRVYAYGDEGVSAVRGGRDGDRLEYRCPTEDCVYTFHMTLDLTKALYSGLHSIIPEVQVLNEPNQFGRAGRQMTLPYWAVYFDNGKPAPPAGSVADAQANIRIPLRGLMGDSQYTYLKESYASVGIRRSDLPWDPNTLAYVQKSGTWTFEGFFEKDTGFVFIDPALHAVPPSKGTVVYEGPGGPALGSTRKKLINVDTTRLTNGMHKLLIGTCNVNAPDTADGVGGGDPNATEWGRGDHCGTLVVRFLVQN